MVRPRLCARPGCSEPAAATLVFQYASRTVWLEDLQEPEPSTIDLCDRHADRLGPPRGWSGVDRRAKALSLAPLPPPAPLTPPPPPNEASPDSGYPSAEAAVGPGGDGPELRAS